MGKMNVLEHMQAARDLIADPERWTQGAYARDEYGEGVDACDETAVCWCSIGALRKVFAEAECVPDSIHDAYKRISESFGVYGNLANKNDDYTHAQVLAAWDKAIATYRENVK